MPGKSQSLAVRAVLAVLLTIGFYGLAFVIIAALVGFVYWEFAYTHRVIGSATLFALAAAATILWSILPRPDRFEPPGPRLAPDKHPRLFTHIREIAQKTNQRMPSEVYLIPDVNAFVAERGGILGIGTRRVMGVGLALLQAMNVSQVRAVLAHEFGHYYGGDTGMAPWVYRTREAIIRTIQSLGRGSWLQLPFKWYGEMFLRITQSIARQQEYAADRLSAQVVGARPMIQALRLLAAVSSAFYAFWETEFMPVLRAGYSPPLAQGLAQFLQAKPVTDVMQQVTEAEARSKTDICDTHPTCHERVAALETLPVGSGDIDESPGISLLDRVPDVEQALLEFLLGKQDHPLKPIAWQEVGTQVYLPGWQATLDQYAPGLKGLTLYTLPEFLRSPDCLADQLQRLAGRTLTPEEQSNGIVNVVGRVLALDLVQRGWKLEVEVGKEVALRQNGESVTPFAMVSGLLAGRVSADEWRERCRIIGIPESTPAAEKEATEFGAES